MTGETEAQNTLTSNNDDDASEKEGEEDGVGDDDEEEEEPEDVRVVLGFFLSNTMLTHSGSNPARVSSSSKSYSYPRAVRLVNI